MHIPVPLKRQTKIAADDILIFYFYLSKKIRLDISSESSARQRIHMKYQVLVSLENNKKSIYEWIGTLRVNFALCKERHCSVSPVITVSLSVFHILGYKVF